jgi:hypothetical protein
VLRPDGVARSWDAFGEPLASGGGHQFVSASVPQICRHGDVCGVESPGPEVKAGFVGRCASPLSERSSGHLDEAVPGCCLFQCPLVGFAHCGHGLGDDFVFLPLLKAKATMVNWTRRNHRFFGI